MVICERKRNSEGSALSWSDCSTSALQLKNSLTVLSLYHSHGCRITPSRLFFLPHLWFAWKYQSSNNIMMRDRVCPPSRFHKRSKTIESNNGNEKKSEVNKAKQTEQENECKWEGYGDHVYSITFDAVQFQRMYSGKTLTQSERGQRNCQRVG